MEAFMGVVVGAIVSMLVTVINDRLRWRREDNIRRENATREDSVHWRERRERVYLAYIDRSRRFIHVARRVTHGLDGRKAVPLELIDQIGEAFKEVAAATDELEVYGSDDARSATAEMPARAWEFTMGVLMYEPVGDEDKGTQAETLGRLQAAVASCHDQLVTSARHDLGLGDIRAGDECSNHRD